MKDIKKIHIERAKKQYLSESAQLLEELKPYVTSIKSESLLSDLKTLDSIEKTINGEHNFATKRKLFKEYLLLFANYHLVYQAAKSANKIIKEKYQNAFSINKDLEEAIQLVNSTLETKKNIRHMKSFMKHFKDQINSVDAMHKLTQRLTDIFNDIEIFRKKSFYENFNKIEFIENKVKEYIYGTDGDGIHQMGLVDLIATIDKLDLNSNKEKLITQLKLAIEKLELLPNSLNELTKYCDHHIILPASDAIWNVKNNCENMIDQIYGRAPAEEKKLTKGTESDTTNANRVMTIFSNLPKDMISEITHYLSFKDVANLRLTSKLTSKFFENEFLKHIKNNLFVKKIYCVSDQSVFHLRNGSLFVCGYDHVNHNDLFDSSYKLKRVELPPVKLVSISQTHSLVLCENQIFFCGKNDYGQFGDGQRNSYITPKKFVPMLIDNVHSIKSVIAGYGTSFIIFKDGSVKACGANEYAQLGLGVTSQPICHLTEIKNLPPIKNVVNNGGFWNDHTIFHCQDGSLYVCGANREGLLGIPGKTGQIILRPTLIPNLPPVEMVCTNGYSTTILCNDGKIRVCGRRRYTGFNDRSYREIPTILPNLPPIKEIAAGGADRFTYLISKEGSVYLFGKENRDSDVLQALFNNLRDRYVPTRIPNLPPIETLAIGFDHVVFLCKNNKVLACGSNTRGQLGLGFHSSYNTIFSPSPVKFFDQIVELYDRLSPPLLIEKNLKKIAESELKLREYMATKILKHINELMKDLASFDPECDLNKKPINQNHRLLVNKIKSYMDLKLSLLNNTTPAIDQITMAIKVHEKQDPGYFSYFKKRSEPFLTSLLQEAENYNKEVKNMNVGKFYK